MTRLPASRSDRAAPARTAVLLLQLGTPDEPTPAAVRRYLREFLSDPRVVEIPRLAWLLILHGVVLRTRPAKSARKYASIWTDEGSPLLVHTRRQAVLLRGALGARGHDVDVAFAMRYGNPSIAAVLRELRGRGVARLLALPLYPQYCASTTATAFDALARELAGWRDQPELRMVRDFHDDPGYLDALVDRVRRAWERDGRAERLVMSPVAAAVHRACAARTGGLGRGQRRRDLSRLRRRLPRDARGDRDRGPPRVPRSRRPGVSLHRLPQRVARLHRRAGGPGRTPPVGLAHPRRTAHAFGGIRSTCPG
jgi:sirohydrochlorin ferrochelatase